MRLLIRRRIPYLGVLLALAIVLAYIEMLLPFDFIIPGVKIGLSNFSVIICLLLFGPIEALILGLSKALLTGFLFGNMTTIIYSVFGAVLSILAMIVLSKIKGIHTVTVSAFGGTFHNIGQFIAAVMIIKSSGLFYYLPILIAMGLVMGILLGIATQLSIPYIRRIVNSEKYKE